RITVKTSAEQLTPLPRKDPAFAAVKADLPKIGGAEIAILDALDKVQPVTQQTIPPQEPGYLAANHLWNAAEKRIRISAARNEFLSFQILVRHPAQPVRASVDL